MDPPDQVVVGGVAVGVLESELGLADPAQPVQRLRLDLHNNGCLARVEAGVELVEWLGTAGEGRVARGQVGHQRSTDSGTVEPVQERLGRWG
jgi:hypothetical protein